MLKNLQSSDYNTVVVVFVFILFVVGPIIICIIINYWLAICSTVLAVWSSYRRYKTAATRKETIILIMIAISSINRLLVCSVTGNK